MLGESLAPALRHGAAAANTGGCAGQLPQGRLNLIGELHRMTPAIRGRFGWWQESTVIVVPAERADPCGSKRTGRFGL